MAMTLEQIVNQLNERHLTGDASRVLAYAQEQKEVLAQAETALADLQQHAEILQGKLDDAEKLFDAAQARLGDKSLTKAEVLAILGVTPAPESADPATVVSAVDPRPLPESAFGDLTPFAREHFAPTPEVQTFALPTAEAMAKAPFTGEVPDSIGAIGFVASNPAAPDVHPFVAQLTAAQDAAKAQGEAVLYGDTSAPSDAVGLDALSMKAPDDPTTPPSAPVGDAK